MSLSNPSLNFEHERDESVAYSGRLYPEILMHPNIPKPLHEVNPRNIMGQEAWDVVRKEAYASTNYHCIACGVHKSEAKGHQWLEAHEFYDIDYGMGRVEIKKIIPLCHYCHNFIHSGRLSMIMGDEKSRDEVMDILEHGFKILADNNLNAFAFTLTFAHEIDANTFGVPASPLPDGEVPAWEDWRLVWDGVEYPPKYPTYQAWQARFSR